MTGVAFMSSETTYIDAQLSAELMSTLLSEVDSRNLHERRSEPRHPLFASVTIHQLRDAGKQIFACSREISQSGIGLLHNPNIDCGTVCALCIELSGAIVSKYARVQWCNRLSDGWYLSGWRFVAPNAKACLIDKSGASDRA